MQSALDQVEFDALRRRWPSRFRERRTITYAIENRAFLKELDKPPQVPESEKETSDLHGQDGFVDSDDNTGNESDADSDGSGDDECDEDHDEAEESMDVSSDHDEGDSPALSIERVVGVLLEAMRDDHLDRKDCMLEFCTGVNLADLEACSSPGDSSCLALLDERILDERILDEGTRETQRSRDYKGPLLAQQLFKELGRQVTESNNGLNRAAC